MKRGISKRRSLALPDRVAREWLRPVPGAPGLRVLFGPQTTEDCGGIGCAVTRGFLCQLADEADFTVIALPLVLSAANRAMIAVSHPFLLVLESRATCLALGQVTLPSAVRERQATELAGGLLPSQHAIS